MNEKTKDAFQDFNKKKQNTNTFVVAGGVASNKGIRNKLIEVSEENNFKTIFPDINLCSDNAAMIAWAGIQRYKKKLFDNKDDIVRSRWPLDKKAPFLKGPGLKL